MDVIFMKLNRRIISIQKTRACFSLSLTSVELNYFSSIHEVVYALNAEKNYKNIV